MNSYNLNCQIDTFKRSFDTHNNEDFLLINDNEYQQKYYSHIVEQSPSSILSVVEPYFLREIYFSSKNVSVFQNYYNFITLPSNIYDEETLRFNYTNFINNIHDDIYNILQSTYDKDGVNSFIFYNDIIIPFILEDGVSQLPEYPNQNNIFKLFYTLLRFNYDSVIVDSQIQNSKSFRLSHTNDIMFILKNYRYIPEDNYDIEGNTIQFNNVDLQVYDKITVIYNNPYLNINQVTVNGDKQNDIHIPISGVSDVIQVFVNNVIVDNNNFSKSINEDQMIVQVKNTLSSTDVVTVLYYNSNPQLNYYVFNIKGIPQNKIPNFYLYDDKLNEINRNNYEVLRVGNEKFLITYKNNIDTYIEIMGYTNKYIDQLIGYDNQYIINTYSLSSDEDGVIVNNEYYNEFEFTDIDEGYIFDITVNNITDNQTNRNIMKILDDTDTVVFNLTIQDDIFVNNHMIMNIDKRIDNYRLQQNIRGKEIFVKFNGRIIYYNDITTYPKKMHLSLYPNEKMNIHYFVQITYVTQLKSVDNMIDIDQSNINDVTYSINYSDKLYSPQYDPDNNIVINREKRRIWNNSKMRFWNYHNDNTEYQSIDSPFDITYISNTPNGLITQIITTLPQNSILKNQIISYEHATSSPIMINILEVNDDHEIVNDYGSIIQRNLEIPDYNTTKFINTVMYYHPLSITNRILLRITSIIDMYYQSFKQNIHPLYNRNLDVVQTFNNDVTQIDKKIYNLLNGTVYNLYLPVNVNISQINKNFMNQVVGYQIDLVVKFKINNF